MQKSVTHQLLRQSESEPADSSVLITRHDNAVLTLPISMAEADFLTATSDGEFASALMVFIESSEDAQSRLGQFFSLSVFCLG